MFSTSKVPNIQNRRPKTDSQTTKLRFGKYPQGEHGCSLGTGTSAEGWVDEMLRFFE